MNIKGIDVSVWQGKIDWKKVKADGIVFAMIRVGYGSSRATTARWTPISRPMWRAHWLRA